MNYRPLKDYYYKNSAIYLAEFEKRKNSFGTLEFPIKIGGHNSFLVLTHEILQSIELILSGDKQITIITQKLPKVASSFYFKECIIDEVMLSNNIEGVHSSRKEIKTILEKNKENVKLNRLYGLVFKYSKLLQNEPMIIPLSNSQDIRTLYDEMILSEVSKQDKPDGKIFRKGSVSVLSATQKEKHLGIMPEEKVIDDMNTALSILEQKDLSFLIRNALFHYFFGYIHPFYDGNGRLSRFISSYLLTKNLSPLISLRLSYSIHHDKKSYYDAFDICNDKKNMGDLTPFVTMFLNVILYSVNSTLEKLQKQTEQLEFYKELIGKITKNKDQKNLLFLLVQNALFSAEPFSMKMLAKEFKKSESTVRNLIFKLKENEFPIQIENLKNKNFYSLDLDLFADYVNHKIPAL